MVFETLLTKEFCRFAYSLDLTLLRTGSINRAARYISIMGNSMANSLSARKRIRQAQRRFDRNRARRGRVRTYIRKVEEAIASGDKSAAEVAFSSAMPELHRGAQKGAFHRNSIARKISGLSRQINAM